MPQQQETDAGKKIIDLCERFGIATVYDFGDEDGLPYIVMEFLDGQPLDKLIPRTGAAPKPAERLEIMEQICAALAYAHRQGMIHRDVSSRPTSSYSATARKLLDSGIARAGQQPADKGGPARERSLEPLPTWPRSDLRGDPFDGRSDIFSTGVLLYRSWLATRLSGCVQHRSRAGTLCRPPSNAPSRNLRRNHEAFGAFVCGSKMSPIWEALDSPCTLPILRFAHNMFRDLSKISSAVLCHTYERGSSFQVPTQSVMDAARSLTLRCVPRRSHLLVSSANQRSTRFIPHDNEVGEVELDTGMAQEQAVDGRVLWVEELSNTTWIARP